MLLVLSLVFAAALCCQSPPAATMELNVNGGGSRGTLVFTNEGIDFKAQKADKTRHWSYQDLREIDIRGPKRLVLDAYETRSRWRFGRTRRVEFDVTAGDISGELVAAILSRAPRAVTTAILPAAIPGSLTVIPASHRRFGSATQGTLEISDAGVAYRSSSTGDSRFWRFSDLQSFAQLTPFEVLVTAYEGGDLHPYAFELKAPLPEAAFDAMWQRINPPHPRSGGAR
jgi:hypothetical protein